MGDPYYPMKSIKKREKGFTLIELLVVIAIIGILATIVLASLNSARMKARDAQRIENLRTLRTAFEFYHDKNAQYPPSPGAAALCTTCIEGAQNNAAWADVLAALGGSALPLDPTRAGTTNGYRYIQSNVNGRQSYTMLVRLERNTTWCRIGTYPGHNSWNQVTTPTNYPPCL